MTKASNSSSAFRSSSPFLKPAQPRRWTGITSCPVRSRESRQSTHSSSRIFKTLLRLLDPSPLQGTLLPDFASPKEIPRESHQVAHPLPGIPLTSEQGHGCPETLAFRQARHLIGIQSSSPSDYLSPLWQIAQKAHNNGEAICKRTWSRHIRGTEPQVEDRPQLFVGRSRSAAESTHVVTLWFEKRETALNTLNPQRV